MTISRSFRKNTPLVLSIFCALLLIFSSSSKDALALQYLGVLIDNGYYSLDHGRYLTAKYYFDKALRSYPENTDALLGKASALIKLQRYNEAVPCLDKVLKTYPHNFYALYGKVIALSSLGKDKEAKIYYDLILKIDPNFHLTGKDLKILHSKYTDYQ